jgi:effector-binding domain-containing protein
MTISRTTPDSILTELVFKDMPPSFGGWTVKDTAEGVNVSVYMNMNMGFFFNFLPGIFMDGWLGGDFEKSLAGLKNHAESLPAKTTSSAKEIKIEPATTPDMIFASYRTMTDTSKISADIGKSLMKVGRFTTKAGLKQAGPVFAIYHSYSPEKIDIECAVPVDKMARGEGDIKVTEWKAGNAVVAHYYGDYAGTGAAYELLKKWIADNNKKTTGPPWEVYVTDPGIEKDTAKWLTEVYFPIE